MKNTIILIVVTCTIIISIFLFFNDLETYFSELLLSLTKNHNAYILVSIGVLISDIVLPVPSSIVMFLNGYVLGGLLGSFISLISLMVSSIIGYYIGSLTSFGLKAKSEKNVNVVFSKYGLLSIIITRGIPVLSESICVVCGYNKVAFKQYLVFNLIGYVPLCLLYSVCGSLGYNKNLFFISFGCSILISVVFWLLGRKFVAQNLEISEV